MRALLVLAFCLVAVATAHEGAELPMPSFDWRDPAALAQHGATQRQQDAALHAFSRSLQAQFPAVAASTNKTCGLCQVAAAEGLDILKNITDVVKAEAEIAAVCKAIFKKNAVEDLICDALPLAVIFVAELLRNRFNFNVPNIVCADMLNACIEPCCADAYAPEQIHISFATEKAIADPVVDYRVTWTTLRAAGDHVWWRAAGAASWQQAAGENRTYTLGGWVGVVHTAVVPGLQAGTTYQYRVGDTSRVNGQSAVFNFTTLPGNAGTEARPLRVLGVADMGFAENAQPSLARMRQLVEAGSVDFIVHPGDIGYADGDVMWWDTFMRELQPIASRVPYMTGIGNHEAFFWNGTSYRHRFPLPYPASAPGGAAVPSDALFYRVRAGPVTFYMLNSESAFNTPEVNDVQLDWLRGVMAAEDKHTLRFATHHRPVYCDSGDDRLLSIECNEYADYMRGRLEDVYESGRVAAVMVGHLHNYQRSFPVYKKRLVAKNYANVSAPMYLINGGAGNREGQGNFPAGTEAPWAAARTLQRCVMTYEIVQTAGRIGQPGGVVTMRSKTIRSTTGEVIDAFNLTQQQ